MRCVLCELNTPRGAGTAREPKSCPPSRSQPSSRAWGCFSYGMFLEKRGGGSGKRGNGCGEVWMLCPGGWVCTSPSSAPPATWIRVDPHRDSLGLGRDWEHSWHSLQQGFPVTLLPASSTGAAHSRVLEIPEKHMVYQRNTCGFVTCRWNPGTWEPWNAGTCQCCQPQGCAEPQELPGMPRLGLCVQGQQSEQCQWLPSNSGHSMTV